MVPSVQPMPLVSVRDPFDHPDWVYEVKWDGFRALAYIDGHDCRLVSRRGHEYKSWPYLATELAHAVRCDSAVLDGEITYLQPDRPKPFLQPDVPARVAVLHGLRSALARWERFARAAAAGAEAAIEPHHAARAVE